MHIENVILRSFILVILFIQRIGTLKDFFSLLKMYSLLTLKVGRETGY